MRAAIPPPPQCTQIANRPRLAAAPTAAVDRGFRGDVAAHEAIGTAEIGRDRAATILRDVGHDHLRAGRVQASGRRLAEARRGSGHERDVAGNLHSSSPLFAMRSTSACSPAQTTYSTLRRCDTFPTFSPSGLWMPIWAPT